MRRVVPALLASVLVLGACDDGSPDIAASQDTTRSTTLSPSEATSSTVPPDGATPITGSPGGPSAPPDAEAADPDDERFCTLARTYVESMSRTAPEDAQGFGEGLREARSNILGMQEVAPQEIVDDLLRLTGVLSVVVPALEAADMDLARVPPDVLRLLQDPEFQASAARLQAYTEDACGPAR